MDWRRNILPPKKSPVRLDVRMSRLLVSGWKVRASMCVYVSIECSRSVRGSRAVHSVVSMSVKSVSGHRRRMAINSCYY